MVLFLFFKPTLYGKSWFYTIDRELIFFKSFFTMIKKISVSLKVLKCCSDTSVLLNPLQVINVSVNILEFYEVLHSSLDSYPYSLGFL